MLSWGQSKLIAKTNAQIMATVVYRSQKVFYRMKENHSRLREKKNEY